MAACGARASAREAAEVPELGNACNPWPLGCRFCAAAARTRLGRGSHRRDYRWAEGRNERYAEIAAEFVRLKVDVIVTVGAAAVAAKQATSVIPIVFWASIDPVGGNLVASLARPVLSQ